MTEQSKQGFASSQVSLQQRQEKLDRSTAELELPHSSKPSPNFSSFEKWVNSLEPEASFSTQFIQLGQTFLKRFRSISPWLWAIVIVVVLLPKVGEIFIAKAFETPAIDRSQPAATVDWQQTEESIAQALQDAHESTEVFAVQKLDAWVADLIDRVDNSFLDWYFGYFNTKELEYKSFFAGITANMARWLNPNSQDPQERIAEIITEEFQTEFAKRVLRPQLAQLQLERITEQTVKYYLNQLHQNISQIPVHQKIEKADWDFYLSQISLSAQDANGTAISLPLKAILGTTAYTIAKPIIAPLLPAVGSKVVVALAGKVGAKIAAKSGTVLAGKIGSTFLDASIGVGILLWDIWDVNHTASVEKPILRQNLVDYLQTVSDSLLNNSDTGIMTVIDSVEQNILQSVQSTKSITSGF